MKTFSSRRWRNVLMWIALSLLVVGIHLVYSVTLHRTEFFSGWFLFILLLALTAYNIRKKFPSLPLGTSSGWLQFHLYTGLFTMVLFSLHINLHVPNGIFEIGLALVYLGVAGSGVVGLALSRGLPRRMSIRGEEVIFERIPALQKRIRERVQELIVSAAAETESEVIADFYSRGVLATRLIPFFKRPRNLVWHLLGSERPRQTLLAALGTQDRYLSSREREIAQEMGTLIQTKDDLDYHYAHQRMLKYWLFVHIPLTYSLLIMALFHAVLVSGYGSGIP